MYKETKQLEYKQIKSALIDPPTLNTQQLSRQFTGERPACRRAHHNHYGRKLVGICCIPLSTSEQFYQLRMKGDTAKVMGQLDT